MHRPEARALQDPWLPHWLALVLAPAEPRVLIDSQSTPSGTDEHAHAHTNESNMVHGTTGRSLVEQCCKATSVRVVTSGTRPEAGGSQHQHPDVRPPGGGPPTSVASTYAVVRDTTKPRGYRTTYFIIISNNIDIIVGASSVRETRFQSAAFVDNDDDEAAVDVIR